MVLNQISQRFSQFQTKLIFLELAFLLTMVSWFKLKWYLSEPPLGKHNVKQQNQIPRISCRTRIIVKQAQDTASCSFKTEGLTFPQNLQIQFGEFIEICLFTWCSWQIPIVWGRNYLSNTWMTHTAEPTNSHCKQNADFKS